MARHIRIIGMLYVLCGVSLILLGLAVLLMFGGTGLAGLSGRPDEVTPIVIPIVGAVGGIMFLLLTLLSIPAIAAGVGLLKHRPWARILTIVLSGVFLFLVPVGTILGLYSLWVLLSKRTEHLFARHDSN
jgi:hypothetical protein